MSRRELTNLRVYKSTVSRLLDRVHKTKQASKALGGLVLLAFVAVTSCRLSLLLKRFKRLSMQEIESILDNPDEMSDMYLANKEAALGAEVEQVHIPVTEAWLLHLIL